MTASNSSLSVCVRYAGVIDRVTAGHTALTGHAWTLWDAVTGRLGLAGGAALYSHLAQPLSLSFGRPGTGRDGKVRSLPIQE